MNSLFSGSFNLNLGSSSASLKIYLYLPGNLWISQMYHWHLICSFFLFMCVFLVYFSITFFFVHHKKASWLLFSNVYYLYLCLSTDVQMLKEDINGAPGWLSGWVSAFGTGSDSGVQDWVPHLAPLRKPASSELSLCLCLSMSLKNE